MISTRALLLVLALGFSSSPLPRPNESASLSDWMLKAISATAFSNSWAKRKVRSDSPSKRLAN